jgi:hypothetical protein
VSLAALGGLTGPSGHGEVDRLRHLRVALEAGESSLRRRRAGGTGFSLRTAVRVQGKVALFGAKLDCCEPGRASVLSGFGPFGWCVELAPRAGLRFEVDR